MNIGITKTKKREALVFYSTRLAVVVQGCSNNGCAFRDVSVGTNMVCRCDKEARELVSAISVYLDKPTVKEESE